MFIRDDIIKEKIVPVHLVHYCRDCNSTDIEVVQTCRQCGSNNIASPFSHKFGDYENGVGTKQDYIEKNVKIYKCDLCGKEFDGLKIDNFLSYGDGEFNNCNSKNYISDEYSTFNGDNFVDYQLQKDLCDDCKQKLVAFLDDKLTQFLSNANIQTLIKAYLEPKNE